MSFDSLGDRMKFYEKLNDKELIPILPICVRIDGRAFHSFCHDLKKPYDIRLSETMKSTTRWLVEETNACIGYTQSDEMTLIYYTNNWDSQVFFNGNYQKFISILASMTTLIFNEYLEVFDLKEKKKRRPMFDARVWNVPNKEEAVNLLIWREQDATRNSIQAAARSLYSQNEIQNKGCDELQEMIFQKGINWNDYPSFFKRGSYFQRKKTSKKFTETEMDKLPLKHAARTNPNLEIVRTDICEIVMPIFSTVLNRVEVVFDGVEPIS